MSTQFDVSRLKSWNTFQSTALLLWGMIGTTHHTLNLAHSNNRYLDFINSTVCPAFMLAACTGINYILYHHKPNVFCHSEDLIPSLWSCSIIAHIIDNHSPWKKMNGASWMAGVLGSLLMIKENSLTCQTTPGMLAGLAFLIKLIIDMVTDITSEDSNKTLPIIGSSAIFMTGVFSGIQCYKTHYANNTTIASETNDSTEIKHSCLTPPSLADNDLGEIKQASIHPL